MLALLFTISIHTLVCIRYPTDLLWSCENRVLLRLISGPILVSSKGNCDSKKITNINWPTNAHHPDIRITYITYPTKLTRIQKLNVLKNSTFVTMLLDLLRMNFYSTPSICLVGDQLSGGISKMLGSISIKLWISTLQLSNFQAL